MTVRTVSGTFIGHAVAAVCLGEDEAGGHVAGADSRPVDSGDGRSRFRTDGAMRRQRVNAIREADA